MFVPGSPLCARLIVLLYKHHMNSKMEERTEVLLKENSDGLQCTDRISKCKDAVCCIFARDNRDDR